MSDAVFQSEVRQKFDRACELLAEALRLVNHPDPPFYGLPDWATEKLNEIVDEYGYRLTENNPDSRE